MIDQELMEMDRPGANPKSTAALPMVPLLTVKEVSTITRLSKAQVYAVIERGVLASIRLPGCSRILVDPADLQDYLRAGRKPARKEPEEC